MIPRNVRVSKAVREYDLLVSKMTGQGDIVLMHSGSRKNLWKPETRTAAMRRFNSPTIKHPLFVT